MSVCNRMKINQKKVIACALHFINKCPRVNNNICESTFNNLKYNLFFTINTLSLQYLMKIKAILALKCLSMDDL